ncbi:FG-GAP repeat-containing protein [Fodinibius sediminis]|uniref:FG-GAP repeat-containing protein n=1 Tax=Fodinibius sediminis TaxID=1214077 RepID=A0A521E4N4_9BACT|nr:FG-GAP repeat-containing protein [Fodinibius sediminis]
MRLNFCRGRSFLVVHKESLIFLSFLVLLLTCSGCRSHKNSERAPLFTSLSPDSTGIKFSNEITVDEAFNSTDFSYIYNGGGVAAGDINNDGLPDLYFTGNMVSSRLYLNKGDFEFEDITRYSGTATNQWAGGASMVDINHDGYLDIYVSMSGPEYSTAEERKNRLFINNGDNTFTESADQYGLADTGYTTHTAFFDYDLDGDLDAFAMNNFAGSFSRDSRTGLRSEVNDGTSRSTDALYRNNGDGTFSDVSREAGIRKEGFSLGIAVADINKDGFPDVYISNDIQTDDLLYINNGDGTFTDKSAAYFKHTSYAGMGADIADFNNDSWPDILQVDMLPPSLEEQQQVTGAVSYDYVQRLKQKGYQRQYTLNTLQLSNGRDRKGNVVFSDIGRLAGIHATDWSWSGLFGDYDNDGFKDIMITNGYPKALNNFDYLMDLNRTSMFGSDSSRKRRAYEMMDQLKGYRAHNYFYRNDGDLTFTDVSEEWGFRQPSFSYGAAQADLDNDGDMDVAVNNMNARAGVYRNETDSLQSSHSLSIRFRGHDANTFGIGARAMLYVEGETLYSRLSPYRGYQSSMAPELHFGLGKRATVDSLMVFWPDGRCQLLKNIAADQLLTVNYSEAESNVAQEQDSAPLFTEMTSSGIDYVHRENAYVDFKREPLLPRMLSRLGPAVATGDVNGDGLDDVYMGGASGYEGKLFIQDEDRTFAVSEHIQPWKSDKAYEDTDAVFFDANGDRRPDLYVVSGGSSHSPAAAQFQDRLYLNAGKGQFVKLENALPRMYTSGSAVKPADFDRDGDMDLFVAGRLVPGQYPRTPRSYLLRNEGDSFEDVTATVAPDLTDPGMITDAAWADFNNDGIADLVTTGVWMPVRFFENRGGRFTDVTASSGLEDQPGWWQSIEKADLDGDGDIDFVAGNAGMNNGYGKNALHLLTGDFDHNSQFDAVLAREKSGQFFPIHGMRSMTLQFPSLRRIQSYQKYAEASMQRLFQEERSTAANHRVAHNFGSSIILNKEEEGFVMEPLPNEAQISSINDLVILDVNGDQNPDLVAAGNTYHTNPGIPRNDAGNGLVLLGDGKGAFRPVSPRRTGFIVPGNVKRLSALSIGGDLAILVANNDDTVQVFQVAGNLQKNRDR